MQVPLFISNGILLLDRSKSQSSDNIGVESKIGPSNEGQFAGTEGRSVAGSIVAHQRDVTQQKKKLSEKMRVFQLDQL